MTEYMTVKEVVSIFRNMYERIKEVEPKPQWNWWSTGKLMNKDEFLEWSKDCDKLEKLLSQFLQDNGCKEFPKSACYEHCKEFPAMFCTQAKYLSEYVFHLENKYLNKNIFG